MSDIKFFRLSGGTAIELQSNALDLEKPPATSDGSQFSATTQDSPVRSLRSLKSREISNA
jgi:hypothetical protein